MARTLLTGTQRVELTLGRHELERLVCEIDAGRSIVCARADGLAGWHRNQAGKHAPIKSVPTIYLMCKPETAQQWVHFESWGAATWSIDILSLRKLLAGEEIPPVFASGGCWQLRLT